MKPRGTFVAISAPPIAKPAINRPGTTMREAVNAIRSRGGEPVGCGVLVDKQGVEEIEGVPVYSLIRVVRIGDD